jgi:ribonuclease R
MEEKILTLLANPKYTPLGIAELVKHLGLPHNQKPQVARAVAQLERHGRIARIKAGNRYALPREADLVPGRLRINRQGVGLLQPADPNTPAIRVPPDATGAAMHGDRVLVRAEAVPRRVGAEIGEVSGRVVRILERGRTVLVGSLQRGPQFLYVIPDDPRFTHDIYVPVPSVAAGPAQIGDKVVVKLRQWKSRHANPEGEIIEVLGPPNSHGVDMLSVIRQYGLPLHFPKAVLHEARLLSLQVESVELAERVDCRGHQVITIDPDDAKDFDDAVCLQRVEPGNWKLWVHIADVSHYVKPGTELDREAAQRGNSTYLVDRVIPMLPEALSNELCSLKPHVDRLTKCVEFLLSDAGRVLKTQFYPAVIRSQCRYNYKEVYALLQRQPLDSLERMLHDANALAQKIRRARFQAGSLDLDFPETKLRLDDQGQIFQIEKVENDLSHQLIEEFMLLANEAVAARLMSSRRAAIYRIHEPPDTKRLEEFRQDVLDHRIPCGNLSNRREVQNVLARLNRLPIGRALKIRFLRSLMRARYAVEPIGHYGLAKSKYTHFTSPIRRYADLVVHRALFGRDGHRLKDPQGSLQDIAEHLSETERNSDDAERDSRDVKLFAFLEAQLQLRVPPSYAALIVDVRNFGFFVEVPGLGMSGLVPLSGLSDDFYRFEHERAQLVGRRTGRVFKLGEMVEVQVAKVDRFKRQVDFKLARSGREGNRRGQPKTLVHPPQK